MRTVLSILTTAVLLIIAASAAAQNLTIYSSLPLTGPLAPDAEDIVKGERRALDEAGARAGAFDIRFTSLDDSAKGTWDPNRTIRNAQEAVLDPTTIGYIGEFNSGASAISIPILNRAGIPQISPSNTYVGLTTNGPGTDRGEPGKYYPTGQRTFFRLTPNDAVQSAALVAAAVDEGCRRVALAEDGDTYGDGIARLFLRAVRKSRLKVVDATLVQGHPRGLAGYARRLHRLRADCYVYGGVTANGAVGIIRAVAAANPGMRFLAADGICESSFTRPMRHLASRFTCTIATGDEGYEARGYEAMKLLLDTIAALGPQGNDRAAVLAALQAMPLRDSPLGAYRFDANGDTTLTTYGLWGMTRSGSVVFRRTIDAGPYV